MRKAITVLGACVVGVIAVEACVGDDPSTTAGASDSGSDSTTTDGSPGGDSSATNDASPDAADAAPAPPPQSCVGLSNICGSSEDCCTSNVVPGGTFFRDLDGVLDAGAPQYVDGTHRATLSTFHLDKYAVTVNRFRKFLAAYPGDLPLVDGAGKNPNDPGDPGWSTTWNPTLFATAADITADMNTQCGTQETWTDESDGGAETKPIDCVTWYEAFAFCIWDGGRLPTSAEYNYAESGGSDQRLYPWSNPPSSHTIDTSYVIMTPNPGPQNVGSVQPGNGKFGQADLVGNVEEWTIDANTNEPTSLPALCNDCGIFDGGASRILRSGAAFAPASVQRSSRSFSALPANREGTFGFRCARNP